MKKNRGLHPCSAVPNAVGFFWKLGDGELLGFRCGVGHAYGTEGLLEAQTESLDTALWSAFRALEEDTALMRRIVAGAAKKQRSNSAKIFEKRAEAVGRQAEVIPRLLSNDMA